MICIFWSYWIWITFWLIHNFQRLFQLLLPMNPETQIQWEQHSWQMHNHQLISMKMDFQLSLFLILNIIQKAFLQISVANEGMNNSSNSEHLLNAYDSIFATHDGKSFLFNWCQKQCVIDGIPLKGLEHSLKGPDSIDVTDDGIDKYLIELQFSKAHLSIVFNVDGRWYIWKRRTVWKTMFFDYCRKCFFLPIVSIDNVIDTCLRFTQFENAFVSIALTDDGIITRTKLCAIK